LNHHILKRSNCPTSCQNNNAMSLEWSTLENKVDAMASRVERNSTMLTQQPFTLLFFLMESLCQTIEGGLLNNNIIASYLWNLLKVSSHLQITQVVTQQFTTSIQIKTSFILSSKHGMVMWQATNKAMIGWSWKW